MVEIINRPEYLFSLFGNLTKIEGIGSRTVANLGKVGVLKPLDFLYSIPTGIKVRKIAEFISEGDLNNNIILIDTFDFLKNKMPNVKEAIIKTGAQRVRPVLLTTFTTVLGLLPMVTMTNVDFVTREISRGSPDTQWWVQLSTAIVFGLIFATILTLIVTPSALMLRENISSWYNRKINS